MDVTSPKCGKFEKDLELMCPDEEMWDDEAPPYMPTQTGIAARVTIPEALSHKSAAAFVRAMNILGLKPYDRQETQTPLFVPQERNSEEEHTKTAFTSGRSSALREVKPQLMLLMKHLHMPEI